ncbi:hypothetical protein BDZ97DRAFT_1920892 [Flammula alnicola]|nr:hypothetical protein BDZ97DRAFT_1920892 [Flammula alnicola]
MQFQLFTSILLLFVAQGLAAPNPQETDPVPIRCHTAADCKIANKPCPPTDNCCGPYNPTIGGYCRAPELLCLR